MSDLLLEWMSFRGEGRLDDLPVELRPGPPRRLLDDFSMLGHLEMPTFSSWRIAPPVLAALPRRLNEECAAVLTGARTPAVVMRFAKACGASGVEMHIAPVPNRPSVIHIAAPTMASIADVAAKAGVPLQSDAAYTLLACLPAIRDWPRQSCRMVAGKVGAVLRFSGSRIAWVESSLAEASAAPSGFFRIQRDWDRVSILKSSETDCAYIDDRAGRMFAAAKRRHVSWSSTTRTIGFPIGLLPPAAVARALALCTGELPRFDRPSRLVQFAGVGPAAMRLTLAITGLRLA